MKDEISNYVGSQIRKYRKLNKMTQKDLGLKVGVKHNTISSYENGTTEPEQNILFEIAKVFNVSINDLFPPFDTPKRKGIELVSAYLEKYEEEEERKLKETPISYTTEKEFINKLELSDKELLNQFDLELDGKEITENETKAAIAYLRTLRNFDK